MTDLEKHVVHWKGIEGDNAVSVFYFRYLLGSNPNDALAGFFDAIRGPIPDTVSIAIDNAGVTVDDETGAVTGVWTGDTEGEIVGGNAAAFPGGVGCCVIWNTGVIAGRRPLRGRTFLVPMSLYDTDGTMSDASSTLINSNAEGLITNAAGSLMVWHRPKKTGTVWGGGSSAQVVSHSLRDGMSFLTSRRP